MVTVEQLERSLDEKRTEASTLFESQVKTAEKESRVRTEDEIKAVEKILEEGRALKSKVAAMKGDDAMRAEIGRLAASPIVTPTPKPRLSMGQQFVQSEAYEFFRKGLHRTQSAWRSPSTELFATILTEDPALGGKLIIPDYRPGILPLLFPRLTIADLMSSGTTTSNLISYMVEKVFTNAAAAVAEAALKPESALTFDAAQDPVRKIAHWLPVSEEMLEDVAQIASYIDARLRLGVQIEEEDQLLNGDGVAPNILGLLHRVGLHADLPRVDPDTNADAILRQMMAIFTTSLLQPDGIVMNPLNWTSTVLMKTTQGAYLAGGPFANLPAPVLWGVPVAITPATAAGIAVTGAFKLGSQVFRHGGIRVEASNSHVDFFIKNLVAIRAEERLALAVYRPGAFGTVSLLT
jgi:HK97 family phage major capsid protein